MYEIDKYEGRGTSCGSGGERGRLGCVALFLSERVFPDWGLVSDVVYVGLGVVMGGMRRVVLLMWIVGVVISLNVVIVCSTTVFMGLCYIYISSTGNDLAGGESVLYFCVDRVLISRIVCSVDVGVLLFSIGSVDRVKFDDRDEPGDCRLGSFCFDYSVSSFVLSTM